MIFDHRAAGFSDAAWRARGASRFAHDARFALSTIDASGVAKLAIVGFAIASLLSATVRKR